MSAAVMASDRASVSGAALATDLLEQGWASLELNGSEQALLAELYAQARAFFGRPIADKRLHATPDAVHGYREFGVEYAASQDSPDLMESMSIWHDRIDLVPEHARCEQLWGPTLAWRQLLAEITTATVRSLEQLRGARSALTFERASSVQINGYLHSPDAEILQARHEDATLLTFAHATEPGLQIELDGDWVDAPYGSHLLLMPASVLTSITGGEVAPLYHRVVNRHRPQRQALIYFVNPELHEPVYAWNDGQRDLRDQIRDAPASFGLGYVPEL